MTGRIVVGIDGSSGSDAALYWAIDEARRRDAAIEAVHAWTYPYIDDVAYLSRASIDRAEVESAAKEVVTDQLHRVVGDAVDVRVETVMAEGSAAHVLTEAAKGADMLVVGSRGHGGFTELLLGSVSHQCAHHAPCPVVIVPAG